VTTEGLTKPVTSNCSNSRTTRISFSSAFIMEKSRRSHCADLSIHLARLHRRSQRHASRETLEVQRIHGRACSARRVWHTVNKHMHIGEFTCQP
jgi:hypothetical protein